MTDDEKMTNDERLAVKEQIIENHKTLFHRFRNWRVDWDKGSQSSKYLMVSASSENFCFNGQCDTENSSEKIYAFDYFYYTDDKKYLLGRILEKDGVYDTAWIDDIDIDLIRSNVKRIDDMHSILRHFEYKIRLLDENILDRSDINRVLIDKYK